MPDGAVVLPSNWPVVGVVLLYLTKDCVAVPAVTPTVYTAAAVTSSVCALANVFGLMKPSEAVST